MPSYENKKKWEQRRHKVSRDIVRRCGYFLERRILKKEKGEKKEKK